MPQHYPGLGITTYWAIGIVSATLAIDARQLMAKNGVGRLVVKDGDKIAGMVTRRDLMKTMKARQDLGL